MNFFHVRCFTTGNIIHKQLIVTISLDSTLTERPANEDETNTLINRYVTHLNYIRVPPRQPASHRLSLNVNPRHILLLLSILASICVGVYIGYPKTSSPTNSSSINSSPVSLYNAPWNDFSRIVCEARFSSWQDIGLWLGYDWHSLQAIRKFGQGSKNQCRYLLAKYAEKNGDSREGRSKVVDSCLAIHIGGRLKDILKRDGYFF